MAVQRCRSWRASEPSLLPFDNHRPGPTCGPGVESWAYFPRHPNDHTFKRVAQGEIAVSQLKPGEKSEALMVKVESRDGLTHVWLSPIVRSQNSVALADPMEITEPTGGRLGSLFAD